MPATFSLPGYGVRRLSQEDILVITDLATRAADYTQMITGEPARPEQEAHGLFESYPPEKGPQALWLIGIFEEEHLIALLEIVQGYPTGSDDYLGLLLIDPAFRKGCLGRRVYQAYAGRARTRGVQRVLLSVVEENEGALRFWRSVGFEPTERVLPDAQYGAKTHRVHELEHVLPPSQSSPAKASVGRYLDAAGRVTVYPSSHTMKGLVLEYLASKFEPGREYTEREVNDLLRKYHTFEDWALLRRDMFEVGLLGRATNGARYWLKTP